MAMANNVFGDPINNQNQTPILRAQQALEEIKAGGKDLQARQFVQNLKSQYGNGVSALCLLYNATGSTITFSDNRDWYGVIWTSPYPLRIQNGQWGAFLHTKRPVVATGSMAAAVYRGRDGTGNNCDYMMSWMHPWGNISNSVCTEVNVPNYFSGEWDRIYSNLERNGRQTSHFWNGCWTTMSTGTEKSAVVEAIFTLEDGTTRGVTSNIPRLDPGVAPVGYDVNAADCDGDAAARDTSEAGDDAAAAPANSEGDAAAA